MQLGPTDYLVLTLVAGYMMAAPYTKVEESFNIQAIHDILIHGLDISSVSFVDTPPFKDQI